jgi:hypothetical protein
MDLADYLSKYRTLVAKEDEVKFQRMLMLAELKPLVSIWQAPGSYTSWSNFLAAEQLCPVSYFARFELALNLYKKSTIERIGVDAAVALMGVEEHLRPAVLDKVGAYLKAYKRRPTTRMVWTFVRALRLLPLDAVVRHGGRHVSHTRH